jgi:hypothetical protein
MCGTDVTIEPPDKWSYSQEHLCTVGCESDCSVINITIISFIFFFYNPILIVICSSTFSKLYSASHSLVAPENVGLQKEQKCNTFAWHTCNEVRLCVLGIRKKEVGNTKR